MPDRLKMWWLVCGIIAAAIIILLYRLAPEYAKRLFGNTDPAKVAGLAGGLGIVGAVLLLFAMYGLSNQLLYETPQEDQT